MWLADEPGAGTRLKLTINLWILNLVENLGETMALSEALGLDQRWFLEAIHGRAMDSPYAQMKGEKIISGDLSPAFSVKLATKDVALAVDMAKGAGVDLGIGPQTLERLRRAIELGHGDEDTAAAWFASRPD
jgi:3-hydroxyisobutyrate dehydrogenase